MNVLRRVAGVTRLEHIRNEEDRQRLQQRSIVDVYSKGEEGELESESDGDTR